MIDHDKTPTRLLLLALGAGAAVACNAAEPASTPAAQMPPAAQTPASSTDNCAALTQFSEMDTRQPVPLQPMMAWHQKQNMLRHLVAIQGITGALAAEDWDEIAHQAEAIESSPQMQQMCKHMGAGAPGFTDLALDFHHRADAIGVAAHAHDAPAVLQAVSNTLKACTTCHATYHQDVVDAASWQARTGETLNPMMNQPD